MSERGFVAMVDVYWRENALVQKAAREAAERASDEARAEADKLAEALDEKDAEIEGWRGLVAALDFKIAETRARWVEHLQSDEAVDAAAESVANVWDVPPTPVLRTALAAAAKTVSDDA